MDAPSHGSTAKANREYWGIKIAENQQRDRDTDTRLHSLGWTVLHVWERQPSKDAADLVQETYFRLLGSISTQSEAKLKIESQQKALKERAGSMG